MNYEDPVLDSPSIRSGYQSIAEVAEIQTWQGIRSEIRRRLTGTITIGFLYLMASLAVGVFLIRKVTEVGRDSVVLDSWEASELHVDWMSQIAWGYVILAIVAVIFYGLLVLLIQGKLPPFLSRIMGLVPAIGATAQMVSVGDFCQSMYQSVAHSRTYADAFSVASRETGDTSLRSWSADSALRVAGGQSLASVLLSSPVHAAPLAAMAAFSQSDLTKEETIGLWHRAAAECHLQAQSRLARATQIVSVSCLLVSVALAALAMLVGTMFMLTMLKGLT